MSLSSVRSTDFEKEFFEEVGACVLFDFPISESTAVETCQPTPFIKVSRQALIVILGLDLDTILYTSFVKCRSLRSWISFNVMSSLGIRVDPSPAPEAASFFTNEEGRISPRMGASSPELSCFL